MLRKDDPEAAVAEGTLTETEAGPLPALALKRERERGRLRPLIPTIPTGLTGRLPPVSA
jgi:hypothetical protein